MLGVIRPNTYHANLRPLQSEFYDFCEREDEMTAPLIAKSVRRLLRKAPSLLLARQTQQAVEQQSLLQADPGGSPPAGLVESEQRPSVGKWQLEIPTASQSGERRLFHSDSSLSSNCSSVSSDSCASSSSMSPFSSRSSLSESNKKKKKAKNVDVILPNDMMTRLVRDIVRVAEGESHGIRGCQLQIEVEDSESAVTVRAGKINCDPKLPPECILRVRLVCIPPPPQAHGSQVLLNRLLGSATHNIYIKPGYTIEKRKIDPTTKVL